MDVLGVERAGGLHAFPGVLHALLEGDLCSTSVGLLRDSQNYFWCTLHGLSSDFYVDGSERWPLERVSHELCIIASYTIMYDPPS